MLAAGLAGMWRGAGASRVCDFARVVAFVPSKVPIVVCAELGSTGDSDTHLRHFRNAQLCTFPMVY
jgi:hypothetical protein